MENILFDEYQLETRRTAPPTDDMIGCLSNFSMGISGESAEVIDLVDKYIYGPDALDKKKLAKELGDLLWYCARISDTIGRRFSAIAKFQTFDDYLVDNAHSNNVINDIIEKGYDKVLVHHAMRLSASAGEITDHMKKVAFQGHDLDVKSVRTALRDVLYHISILTYMNNMKLSEVAMMNIDKLRARYPKGFSVEDSRNRKDKE